VWEREGKEKENLSGEERKKNVSRANTAYDLQS